MWNALAVPLAGVCLCAGVVAFGARCEKAARPRAARWAGRALGPAVGLTVLVSLGVFNGASAGSLAGTATAWAIGGALGTFTAVIWRRRKRLRTARIDQDPDQPRIQPEVEPRPRSGTLRQAAEQEKAARPASGVSAR